MTFKNNQGALVSVGLPENIVELFEDIVKADALLKIILSADLDNVPRSTIHDVLWLLDDLISNVRKICEKL